MKEEIGTYRKNQKGFGFVKLEGQEEEIYISKENSYNALNGDTVAIKIISEKEADKKAEGKIIKIVRHEKDTVVGTFQKNRNFGFVVPDDKNFGTDIFISKSHWGKARNNHKVLVKIIKYPEKGKNAEGEIIEVLGGVNEAGVDMLSLIRQYELPYKFPEEVVSEAKAFGNKINEKNLEGRRDLRQDIIFTIDGEDAKDLDDAIHVEKLTNGNYRLDVHIADVSNYVREKTELDKEAYLRGTSIYMLGRVIPMLPRELSNGICSLNAGEDRFTLSCSMEITPKAKVVSSDIYKAVIRVTERMSYTDVQKILDRSDKTVLKRYEKYISHFDLMAELANILKDKRRENGYLNLDIPESKIILDENGVAIDVKKYETYFANEIIEQFMLIANETVAERFYWLQAPFIYRNHEAPDLDKVKDLNMREKNQIKKRFLEVDEWTKNITTLQLFCNSMIIFNLDELELLMKELEHTYRENLGKYPFNIQRIIASICINYFHNCYTYSKYEKASIGFKLIDRLAKIPDLGIYLIVTNFYRAFFNDNQRKCKEILNFLDENNLREVSLRLP